MDKPTLDDLRKVVRGVSRNVATRWPHSVEADDLEQDVMILLLERPNTWDLLADCDSKQRRQIVWMLCTQAASDAQVEYEHFSGQYNYSVSEVRSLLEEGVLTEQVDLHYEVEVNDPVIGVFQQPVVDPYWERAAIVDLKESLRILKWEKSPYATAITDRYVRGVTPERKSADEKRLERAVEKLTLKMNRLSLDKQRYGVH
jgi:hypothetical protein